MGRFKIAYDIGKNVVITDIKESKDNATKIKIKDKHNILPDLVVTDVDIARKWIKYFNQPDDTKKDFEDYSSSIKYHLKKINTLNDNLIKPKSEYIGYDEKYEKDMYEMSLRDRLFYEGYQREVNKKSKTIFNLLDKMKKLVYE